jgi:hypothetical protein
MSRGIRLKSLPDIRRFAARVANMLYKDEMDEGKARALAYLCNTMKDIIKDSDVEERVAALEALRKEQEDNEQKYQNKA